jgi:hypothetical protein
MKIERGFISLCSGTSGNSAKRCDKTADCIGYIDYLSECKLLTLGYDPCVINRVSIICIITAFDIHNAVAPIYTTYQQWFIN